MDDDACALARDDLSAAPATEPGTLAAAAQLRAEPRADAPVVGAAASGDAVHVELRAVNGYCRVTTAGGAAGYVPLEVVNLRPAPAKKPVLHTGASWPDREELARAIPERAPPRAPSHGASAGHTIAWLSVALGAGVLLANTFRDPAKTSPQAIRSVNRAAFGVMIVGPIAGLGMASDDRP